MQASLGSPCLDVLIAEDDSTARDLLASIFEEQAWARPTLARDGVEALAHLQARSYDILISDLNMPRMSGEELVLEALSRRPELTVMVITGNATVDKAVHLMKAGVYDFLTKPYSLDHFLVSLERARDRVLNQQEIQGIREVVDALLAALESKDRYLNGHCGRVARFSVELGRLVGLSSSQLQVLEYAGKLHDVGKIGIHEDILNKAGKLTVEEFEIMKTHPVLSRDILVPVRFLAPCLPAVLHHHERIDGDGYPHGLRGNEIPLEARIISVVDSYDAMTSTRSYRPALGLDRVLRIIQEVSGTQLDAELAELFLTHHDAITGVGAVATP